MILGVLQIVRCHVQEIAGDQRILLSDVLEAPPLRKPNSGIDNRFSGEAMDRAILQAEDVANQMKCSDLAAAVGEQLVTPHCAFHHLIHIFSGLGLSENLSAPGVFEPAQDELRVRQAALLAEEFWPIARSSVDVDKHGSLPV